MAHRKPNLSLFALVLVSLALLVGCKPAPVPGACEVTYEDGTEAVLNDVTVFRTLTFNESCIVLSFSTGYQALVCNTTKVRCQ